MIDGVQLIISTSRAIIVLTIESENVFETKEDTNNEGQNQLQMSESREALQVGLGPLDQKYETVLRGTQDKESGRLRVRRLSTQG